MFHLVRNNLSLNIRMFQIFQTSDLNIPESMIREKRMPSVPLFLAGTNIFIFGFSISQIIKEERAVSIQTFCILNFNTISCIPIHLQLHPTGCILTEINNKRAFIRLCNTLCRQFIHNIHIGHCLSSKSSNRDISTFSIAPFRIVIAYFSPLTKLFPCVIDLTIIFIIRTNRTFCRCFPMFRSGYSLFCTVSIFQNNRNATFWETEKWCLIMLVITHGNSTSITENNTYTSSWLRRNVINICLQIRASDIRCYVKCIIKDCLTCIGLYGFQHSLVYFSTIYI